MSDKPQTHEPKPTPTSAPTPTPQKPTPRKAKAREAEALEPEAREPEARARDTGRERPSDAPGAAAAAAASVASGSEAGSDTETGTGADSPSASGPERPSRPSRPPRTGLRRFVPTWRTLLGTFIGLVLLLTGLFALGYYLVGIPAANASAVQQSNVYLYADGSQLARDGEINREIVPLDQISRVTRHAVLAAEDRDFYSESAVDPQAMIRAAWNTATGKGRQSGSTITQQYVKNYYLAQDQTLTRKVKEFFISIKLDREESKDDILEGYLNTSYFGRNAYGIQAAAQAYYGVDAQDLTAAQGAYLAALLNAPSSYDVVGHPENRASAVARWNYVLDGMVEEDWLSGSDRAAMKFPTPKKARWAAGMSGQRGYVVQAVKEYLAANRILDEDTLAGGGYRITTTLHKRTQNALVEAVDDQVTDELDRKNRKVDAYVRAGGVSLDPETGEVIAMYGGIDYTQQYVNNATRRDYQVGSTFKPFVFTSAVENGSRTQDGRVINPNTVYDGTDKRAVQGWAGPRYAPENEDNVRYGQIPVRTATEKSVNAVYAQMAVDVGPAEVKKTAQDLGIPADTPDLVAAPSIALGPATASVLDMAQAYATLADHGRHHPYTLVAKVTKGGSQDVRLPGRDTRQAVSREAADTTTAVLQGVIKAGTGTAVAGLGRPAAGKTGTAEEDQAAWFAGYTPDLVTVVSVMGQDPKTGAHKPLYGALGQSRINGGSYPAQIWAQYTRTVLRNAPASDFELRLQEGADETEAPSTSPSPGAPDAGDRSGRGHGESREPTAGDDGHSPSRGQTRGGDQDGTQGRGDDGSTTQDGGAPAGGGTPDRGRTGGAGQRSGIATGSGSVTPDVRTTGPVTGTGDDGRAVPSPYRRPAPQGR
ncbi:transglycosylase domain-containing protein [Streptomyces sp. NPDC008313]|uniref:transglycosylase domain-containing protein n=1 Tax=Streptomyces sp. NPDC008313 TaxID=3364826 RepID=UPI0036E0F554